MTIGTPNAAPDEYITDGSPNGRNAGEEYIKQLAKQSARRKSAGEKPAVGKQTADAYMESLSGLSEANYARGEYSPDESIGALNAGDQYMAQLSRQTALSNAASRLAERDVFDSDEDRQGPNAGEDYLAQLAKQSAGKASNSKSQSAAHETPAPVTDEDDAETAAVDAEIARLTAQVAALESALGTMGDAQQLESCVQDELGMSEAFPSESGRDDPVVASNDATVQDLDSYKNMREMLSDHVAPPSAVPEFSDLETSSFEEASAENSRKTVDVDGDAGSRIKAIEDAKSSELAMVEIQIEMERYSIAARNLLEKHEQHIQTIIEKYMPGL